MTGTEPDAIIAKLVERTSRLECELVESERAAHALRRQREKEISLRVEEARASVEDQLAHRFGREMLRALRNPLRFPLLPVSLAAQWLRFRADARRRGDKACEAEEPGRSPGSHDNS